MKSDEGPRVAMGVGRVKPTTMRWKVEEVGGSGL
jgi:hypothetical protein